MQCPVCHGGKLFGETGGSCAHLARGWIDTLKQRTIVAGDAEPRTTASSSDARGSEVGFSCVFEQCKHLIEYRFVFHKGDVYVEWREARAIDYVSTLPRD